MARTAARSTEREAIEGGELDVAHGRIDLDVVSHPPANQEGKLDDAVRMLFFRFPTASRSGPSKELDFIRNKDACSMYVRRTLVPLAERDFEVIRDAFNAEVIERQTESPYAHPFR